MTLPFYGFVVIEWQEFRVGSRENKTNQLISVWEETLTKDSRTKTL